MDFFQSFSNVVIPRWVKVTVAAVLISLLAMNLLTGFFGITGTERQEDWLEASIYLFGVLLPIWLIVFVILYSDGGTSALKTKTYEYMTKVLPASFKSIIEEPAKFYTAGQKTAKRTASPVKVLTNQYRDSCVCRYIIEFNDARRPAPETDAKAKKKARNKVRIHVSLELNVKKANLVIHIPEDRALAQLDHLTPSDLPDGITLGLDDIQLLFPHTMTGAIAEGYTPNATLQCNAFEGRAYYGLVLFKQLAPNFLTQPQEKLYFAQDLMFMLKAFYNENPAMFAADPAVASKQARPDDNTTE